MGIQLHDAELLDSRPVQAQDDTNGDRVLPAEHHRHSAHVVRCGHPIGDPVQDGLRGTGRVQGRMGVDPPFTWNLASIPSFELLRCGQNGCRPRAVPPP